MRFSPKQRLVLSWWGRGSPYRDREAIICDGAVRSGKTFCMGLSFFAWAMREFNGARFALCGRSVGAVWRNLLEPLAPLLRRLRFQVREERSRNRLTVRFGGRENRFYLFGGMNEASGALIQGMTLAGALMDEVALMPRSFVEQTMARCSAEGARIWFSCNPEGPEHWFYKEWVLRAEERRALRVRFTMEDNPGLSRQVKERYQRMFRGSFYQRFVLGEWRQAEGLVYDFFCREMVQPVPQGEMEEWRVSCDYGTINPTSMGLWGRRGEVWFRVGEFYYDARKEGRQMTDREYVRALEELAAGRRVRQVVVDPSAASFMAALREEGWPVTGANNDVLTGIRVTAELLRQGRLVICETCGDAIREFGLYRWDEKAAGDRVVKRFDHAMDDIRYFAMTVEERGYSCGGWVEREGW